MEPTLDISALPRACHEALVLAVLADGPRHGYQLVLDLEQRSGGAFLFKHGTLYPTLHRLEQDGAVRSDWSEGPGRKRRSYVLTEAGSDHLADLHRRWEGFSTLLLSILGGNRS